MNRAHRGAMMNSRDRSRRGRRLLLVLGSSLGACGGLAIWLAAPSSAAWTGTCSLGGTTVSVQIDDSTAQTTTVSVGTAVPHVGELLINGGSCGAGVQVTGGGAVQVSQINVSVPNGTTSPQNQLVVLQLGSGSTTNNNPFVDTVGQSGCNARIHFDLSGLGASVTNTLEVDNGGRVVAGQNGIDLDNGSYESFCASTDVTPGSHVSA